MKEIILNNFYGGIADSINENSPFKFDVAKHFDIYSDPKKLVPIPTIVANNSGITSATNKIGNFLDYDGYQYALGVKGATTDEKAKIWLNSGTSGAWTATTSGESGTAGTQENIVFLEYKGIILGKRSNQHIWSYNVSTDTFNASVKDCGAKEISYTNGIIGKANGYVYIPTNNKLWQSADGATFTQANITIPTNEKIYGLQNYGNYLAILTRNTIDASSSRSYIYLWDFSSLLATDILELPDNGYSVLGLSGSTLIAVGQRITTSGSEISAVAYSTGAYEPIFNKIYPSTVSVVKGVSRSQGGTMYFAVNDTTTGRPYQGIWSIGRKKSGYPLATTIAFDYLENGGTASNIVNFLVVNQGVNQSYGILICTADCLIHKIGSLPSSTVAFTYATDNPISYIETARYYPDQEARLTAVSVKYDAQPANGVVTLSYRIDNNTSWTPIFSDSVDSSTGHISTNIESTGAEFPTFKNIQFKITSLGGSVITDFRFKAEELTTIYG